MSSAAVRLMVLALLLPFASPVLSQDGPATQERAPAEPEQAMGSPAAPVNPPAIAAVEARIAEVEADANLTQAERDALLAPLQAAQQSLEARDVALAERQEFLDLTAAAPGTIEQLQQELDQPSRPPELPSIESRPPDEALQTLRALIAETQARLDAAQAEQARVQTETTRREAQRAAAPAQLVQWGEELAESITELAALPNDSTDPVPMARRWQKQAEAAELAARIARLEAEIASYNARRDLLPLRLALAQRKADVASRFLQRLRAAETEAANRLARQAQQQALEQASDVDDRQLQELARETSELAAKRLGRRGTLERLESVRVAINRADNKLSNLRRRAENTVARVQAAGLTEIVGQSLRQQLRELPQFEPEPNDQLKSRIEEAQLELIGIQEKLSQYGDLQAAYENARVRIAGDADSVPANVEAQITEIISNYVQTLRELESDYQEYIEAGFELSAKRETLAQISESFRTFIEERILWTRSVQGPSIPRAQDVVDGGIWLLGGKHVPTGTAATDVAEQPIGAKWLQALADLWPPQLLTYPVALALIGSFWARRRARKALRLTAGQVRKFSTDSMRLTLQAIPLTIIVSLPLPIALALGGLLLSSTDVEVARAVGRALYEVAIFALVIEFVRHAARTDGLLEAHFRWRREGLVHLRRFVFLLATTLIPIAILTRAYTHQPDIVMNDAVGRPLFVLSQLVLAAFMAATFAPWLPFVRNYLVKHQAGVINQTRWIWYPLLVGAPIALAVLAAIGFYYTAAQLYERLHLTGWLAVAAAIAYNLVLRWLFIERRRMLVKRAQQRRQEEAAEKAEKGQGIGEDGGIEIEAPELDAAEVDTQTRRVLVAAVLVSVVLGMYALWAQQLPALRMLERVQLWPSIRVIDTDASTTPAFVGQQPGLAAGPNDQPSSQPLEQASDQTSGQSAEQPPSTDNGSGLDLFGTGSTVESTPSERIGVITLADLGAAFLFFAITYVLARNLPGLLEITLLKRLPLDAGARFAVTSILRYFIGIVGIVLGFGAVGIGWSQVQFLAAALTFGLAFGLQEIFANFISGLIILAERPVRVGDTVTVNNVDGRVTRIRMRATTVLDWELRELIIPNKVFITDQFINWTLSDPRIRVTIPVGVSYGSDVRLVERTLLEIGQAYEHGVAEPRVRSLFLGFGESTLDFQLRVYVEHFDFYLEAKSTLHQRIFERFRELGIEIAFPQRDLHVRNIGPLANALERRNALESLPKAGDEDASTENERTT